MNTKKLTILHSNDMHGDFVAKQVDDKLLGGVSMLSGYVNKVRSEEENVIYAISGDMFRGSIIDSEYKGLSTIQIMNLLAPDVVTLGNHEVDYGIAHLLFIEKCAQFPIINANMYVTMNHVRLFNSHIILEIDGMKVLFIGILTEQVLNQTKLEGLIGSLVDIKDAVDEVGKICNYYRNEDIDFTVLLTHIGIEADVELAANLDPRWGVDIIIGGHSHTYLEEPIEVNGIPIVQAAYGTSQIGRFDITVNTDTNSIHEYTWKLVPIDEGHCPRDLELENVIVKYKEETDQKYKRIITRFANCYTHPDRKRETSLGKIFSDVFVEALNLDFMFLLSGSIRADKLGPIVMYDELVEAFPYDDEIYRLALKGDTIKKIFEYILRDEAFFDHTEFFQLSKGLKVRYDKNNKEFLEMTFNGENIDVDKLYFIGLQGYAFKNFEYCFGMKLLDAVGDRKVRVASTNSLDILEEYFSHKEIVKVGEESRLILS